MNPTSTSTYYQAPSAPPFPLKSYLPVRDSRPTRPDSSVIGGLVRPILAVLSRWDIPEKLGCVILGSAQRDFLEKLKAGDAGFETRDTGDRARLFFDIYEGVFNLLNDRQAERDWIRARRADFDGQSLLDLMTEGSQRNLIRALAFVDYVNGR